MILLFEVAEIKTILKAFHREFAKDTPIDSDDAVLLETCTALLEKEILEDGDEDLLEAFNNGTLLDTVLNGEEYQEAINEIKAILGAALTALMIRGKINSLNVFDDKGGIALHLTPGDNPCQLSYHPTISETLSPLTSIPPLSLEHNSSV